MTEPEIPSAHSSVSSFTNDPARLRVLERILREAQRTGALSAVPVSEIISHAQWFTKAIPATAHLAVDLGSGAGVPGLIVAIQRPDLELVLVDRRAGRTDNLLRAVIALNLADRVSVRCCEIDDMARDSTWAKHFDVVMSRGLGPAVKTLNLSRELVKQGGVIIVSEPPPGSPSRWNAQQVSALGLEGPIVLGAVAMFHVKHSDAQNDRFSAS